MLTHLGTHYMTGSGLKWDCAKELWQQCYTLLASWVRDYLEQVMVIQDTLLMPNIGYFPMCACEAFFKLTTE